VADTPWASITAQPAAASRSLGASPEMAAWSRSGVRRGRSRKRANSTSLPPYDRPPTTGGVGLMLHDRTVVKAPVAGGGGPGPVDRKTGWRVGSHRSPAGGTPPPGRPPAP